MLVKANGIRALAAKPGRFLRNRPDQELLPAAFRPTVSLPPAPGAVFRPTVERDGRLGASPLRRMHTDNEGSASGQNSKPPRGQAGASFVPTDDIESCRPGLEKPAESALTRKRHA